MKHVKIAFFTAFFLVAAFSMLSAQTDDNYRYSGACGDRAGYMADYLDKELNLDDSQYNKVYSAFLIHEQQRDSDFEKYSPGTDEFRDASGKRRAKLDADLKGILSQEQYTQYTGIKDNMMGRMSRKFGKRRHHGRSGGWLEALSIKINSESKTHNFDCGHD
jgi:hypothetical protein